MKKRLLSFILILTIALSGCFVFSGCVKEQFTVWFDGNGGTLVLGEQTQKITSADDIVPPVYEREGYKFDGWSVDLSKIQGNTIVEAKWINYTVTFNANGGTLVLGDEVQVVPDLKDVVYPIYERTGYTLSFDVSDPTTLEQDYVINAVWTANEYTLTFDVPTTPDTITVAYDSQIGELPVFVSEEYGFRGWTVDGVPIYAETVWNWTDDKQAIAKLFAYDEYMLYCDYNGGTVQEENPETYRTSGQSFTLNNPTKVGYDFIGWVDYFDSDSQPSLSITINNGDFGNKHYVAIWSPLKYDLSFDANGGELVDTNKRVSFGEPVGELPVPTLKGFDFDGWLFEGQIINKNSIWNVSSNGVLTASWKRQKYNLKLNVFDGSVSPKTIAVEYGLKVGELPTPNRDGGEFIGWYYNDELITCDTVWTDVNANGKELVSKWIMSKFTVNYSLDCTVRVTSKEGFNTIIREMQVKAQTDSGLRTIKEKSVSMSDLALQIIPKETIVAENEAEFSFDYWELGGFNLSKMLTETEDITIEQLLICLLTEGQKELYNEIISTGRINLVVQCRSDWSNFH